MKGQKVVQQVSDRAGIPLASLRVIGRALREADQDLFPWSNRGPEAAEIEPRHCAALTLALGQAVVIGAADAVLHVGGFRDGYLGASDFDAFYPALRSDVIELRDFFRKRTLLESLAALYDWVSEDRVFNALLNLKIDVVVHVNFRCDYGYSVDVEVRDTRELPDKTWCLGHFQDLESDELGARMRKWSCPIAEKKTFKGSFIVMLAECWRSTKARRSSAKKKLPSKPPTSGGSNSGSEGESPAPGSAGLSTSKRPEDDAHPTARQNGLLQRSNGRSPGGEESRDAGFRPASPATPPAPGDPHATERRHLAFA